MTNHDSHNHEAYPGKQLHEQHLLKHQGTAVDWAAQGTPWSHPGWLSNIQHACTLCLWAAATPGTYQAPPENSWCAVCACAQWKQSGTHPQACQWPWGPLRFESQQPATSKTKFAKWVSIASINKSNTVLLQLIVLLSLRGWTLALHYLL
jgi:hypothetical protein